MKNICITGATSGIGKAIFEKLTKKEHTLILPVRNLEKAKSMIEDLKVYNKSNIYLVRCDIISMHSVSEAAKEINKKFNSLDVLINNAGIGLPEREITEEGFEKVFATNYLGHFFLTKLLLDKLILSAPSRIINITSQLQYEMDFSDLMSEKNYSHLKTYGRTKSALLLFTYELARRIKDKKVTVNAVHPGLVNTNIYDDVVLLQRIFIRIISVFFKSPQKSADYILPLILDDKYEKVTGKYFINLKTTEPKKYNTSENNQKILWDLSEKLIRTL